MDTESVVNTEIDKAIHIITGSAKSEGSNEMWASSPSSPGTALKSHEQRANPV